MSTLTAVQEQPGYYWKLNDAVGMRFSHSDGEAPTEVKCHNTHDFLNQSDMISVPLVEMEFLGSAEFGEGRPCRSNSATKWTGSSHRYALYVVANGFNKGVVMVENHGGGMVCYLFHTLTAIPMWTGLVATLNSPQLWDVCHEFAGVYREAKKIERRAQHSLFLAGRLKRRKQDGRFRVEVLPAVAVQ